MPDRPVRLSILVDADAPLEMVGRLATLAQRAGLDGLWLAASRPPGTERPGAFERLAFAATRTGTLTLGAYLAEVPAADALPTVIAGRLEVTVPEVAVVGSAFEMPVIVALDHVRAGRLPAGVAGAVVPVAALSTSERPDWPSLAVELGASIGRTASEAAARLGQDNSLRGRRDPRRGGLFGTLEECQSRAGELGRMGVTELRCWLPDLPDVGDVIAQLSAVKVSTGDGREAPLRGRPPPPPPAGWGGRPRRP